MKLLNRLSQEKTMPKIFESPDKGKTIFVREFGEDPKDRVELSEYVELEDPEKNPKKDEK